MPRSRTASPEPAPQQRRDNSGDGIDDLTFQQARTALELILAELQGADLEVEAMADLYRRALRYADRCEAVLREAEHNVMQWDPQNPDAPPKPLPH
ncbi:MAG: exodeoxyribonuclease VII small subunit [Cyanobium sp.]